MRNTPKSLNEELMKMRKLMNFDISENSHDVLSENFVNEQNKTHIGTKRKGLDIVWGKGKTITLRKGKKNSSKEISQGETKPTKPEEGWDDFLKGDQKMVGLMSGNSKKYWGTLKNSDNGIEKGFAVAALEEFIKTDPENKWKKVTLGKETVEDSTPDDDEKEYPALTMSLPMDGKPSSDFFDDNKWAPTELLQQTVKTEIIDPVLEWLDGKKECEGVPMVYLNDITVKTSASRFRNGIKSSWLDLSKNRNDAALSYIKEQLKNVGVYIDGNTVITQEIKGENGDGTSGPNPGKNPDGRQYAISTDGNNDNVIENYTEEIINQFGAPLSTKEEYEKYKYCVVTLTLVLNDCRDIDIDTDEEIVVLEVDNYSIKFSSGQPPLKIKLPAIKWKWIKKQKNNNKLNKFRRMTCDVFKRGKRKGKAKKKSSFKSRMGGRR